MKPRSQSLGHRLNPSSANSNPITRSLHEKTKTTRDTWLSMKAALRSFMESLKGCRTS
jgi:hypothetical protein